MPSTEPNNPFTWYSPNEHPKNGDVVIAFKDQNTSEQCEYHDGKYFVWRYAKTDEVFATDETILKYRGCTGFDF